MHRRKMNHVSAKPDETVWHQMEAAAFDDSHLPERGRFEDETRTRGRIPVQMDKHVLAGCVHVEHRPSCIMSKVRLVNPVPVCARKLADMQLSEQVARQFVFEVVRG